MPLTKNPFADDPDKAEVFEMGYLLTLQGVDDDPFLPLSPDLLDVFRQGAKAGRDDAPLVDEKEWVRRTTIDASEGVAELAKHSAIEAVFEGSAHLFKLAGLGLIGLVISVLGIPGNVKLGPLKKDFSEEYDGPDEDPNVTYVPLCSRTDHPLVMTGVTPDGYWAGTGTGDFNEALKQALQHEHTETLIARCSTTDSTCGPVWIAQ